MKQFWQSKTMWSNLAILVTTIGAYFTQGLDIKTALALSGAAILNMGLRMITSTPIGNPTK